MKKKFNTFASVTKMPVGKTKEERREYYRWWRNKDIKDYNKKRLEWTKKYPERRRLQARRSHLYKTFGITMEEFEELLIKHNNKCAICGKEFKKVDNQRHSKYTPCIDHCHKSEKIRGLLCLNCNMALGCFQEDKEILMNAIKYLDNQLDDKAINPKDLEGIK